MKSSLITILVLCTIVLTHASKRSMSRKQESLIRMLIQTRDNYGCDALIPSCGPKGKCCDYHDECYKKYKCRASSWAWSWIPGVALFEPCARCNKAAFICITNIIIWPGPSQCCTERNCGWPRQRIHRS